MSTIVLHRYQFEVSDPYTAGLAMDDNEAVILNRTRAEYIRSNALRWVLEEEEKSDILSSEAIERVREKVAALDARFEFAPRKQSRRSQLDYTLQEVAKEKGADILDSEVQAEARLRLEARNEILREAFRKFGT